MSAGFANRISGVGPHVGISACLLGQPVRYDGRDKRSAFLVEALAPHVTFVPFCPELEAGMGVPREPVQLVREADGLRMRGVTSRRDFTDAMTATIAARLPQAVGLAAYVWKARSPSCGLTSTPRFDEGGAPLGTGAGLFAEALRAADPTLVMIEETALDDAGARVGFLMRLFAVDRLAQFFATRPRLGDLVAFHTRHKMLLLAHHEPGYRALGRVVATGKERSLEELYVRYREGFHATLAHAPSAGSHANALTHLAGHVSDVITPHERAALAAAIEAFRLRDLPLAKPLAQLRAHAEAHELSYPCEQVYLTPFPTPLWNAC